MIVFGFFVCLLFEQVCLDTECSRKEFRSKQAMQQHQATLDHGSFKCLTCARLFASDRAMEQHQASTDHWRCKICLKDLRDADALDRHRADTSHYDSDDELASDSDSD